MTIYLLHNDFGNGQARAFATEDKMVSEYQKHINTKLGENYKCELSKEMNCFGLEVKSIDVYKIRDGKKEYVPNWGRNYSVLQVE